MNWTFLSRIARRATVSCAVMAFVAGPASVLAADPPPLKPPVKIKVNSAGLSGEAGLYLALDKGYFAAEGIQIELIQAAAANSSTDTLAQLSGGDLDIGSLGMSSTLFNAIARGVGVVGLLPMNTISKGDRSSGLVVRQDHIDSGRYKTPKDLKGMKVAVLTLGGTGHYNVRRAAQAAGLKDDDVEYTTLTFPDAVVALANKSIDAAFEVEPFIGVAKAKGAGSLMVPAADTSLGAPSIIFVANAAFATKNKEAVQRFLVAMLKGQRDYVAAVKTGAGKDQLYKSLATYTPMKDLARLQAMALPTVDPNGEYDRAALESLQSFFVSARVVLKPIDLNKVFDSSLLDAALARVGKVSP